MSNFAFATATKILFGPGSLKGMIPAAKDLGVIKGDGSDKAMVITGKGIPGSEKITGMLEKEGIPYFHIAVHGEPTTEGVDSTAEVAKKEKVTFVISMGGGSVLDTGKGVAMLVANGGQSLDYMEVIGKGKKITKPALPCIAVTTTAGTGAEVTKNAVLKSVKHKQKVSLRSDHMYAKIAVVDPSLLVSVPNFVMAASGMDAITQCLEPLTSCLANPLTDAIAARGLHHGARAIRAAYKNPNDSKALYDMALCSLFGGLALANSKLGAVHGFAGPLGGELRAPHGAICGALLPAVVVTNLRALQSRDPSNPAVVKFKLAAEIVFGRSDATVKELALWIAETCQMLKIPPLSKYGLTEAQFPMLVKKCMKSSSMKGNPLKLTEAELTSILRQACSENLVNTSNL